MAEKLLLIDGSSLIHRAFFALPPLTTKKGVNTGAVYGFCNMLLKLLQDEKPQYVAIAFDKSRKTFRTRKYEQYKAQRKPTPSELAEQFPLALKLFTMMGIKAFEVDDYEADDIIGTLSAAAADDVEVRIVTGDKDEFQLIKDNVKVYYTKHGISDIVVYDAQEFARNYEGLAPKQIIDLKGLMGDASDNIPGIPGVGPKTALKLLVEYRSVENVLDNADKVSGKSLKEKLLNNKEQALMSKDLATICLEAPVDKELSHYTLQGMTPEAKSLMEELQFRTFWDRFLPVLGAQGAAVSDEPMSLFGEAAQESKPTYDQKKVITAADKAKFWQKLQLIKTVVPMTYECAGEIPELAVKKVEFFLDNTNYVLNIDQADEEELYAYLADARASKALCDAKELYKAVLCHGRQMNGVTEDIALAAYLYEPGETSYVLPTLVSRYLGGESSSAAQVAALVPKLQAYLKEKELTKLYNEIELPLTPILAQMEVNGIKIDRAMLADVTKEMTKKVADLESLAMEQAGEEFNLKSPKQLGQLLFEKLNLPVIKKTKTGYSTDVSVLEELQGRHPVVDTILEHRKLSKLLSTYLEGLEPLVNKITGRIHTHFQQMVTVTGRLSSTEPNLQNIPTRTEVGRRMREMFVPGEGYDLLMSCDYSQVELRVMASIAQDQLLMDSFAKGQDVHARTASEVFGVPLEEVTAHMRMRAKTVNFGIIYGISDYGLSKQLGVPRAEAARYIESYFTRYVGVKAYMEAEIAKAKKLGYVETLFGRRRYLPDINHSNYNLRSFAERTAINTPIQGTAADIIKVAMLKVAKALQDAKVKSRVLLQVHDELVLEVTNEEKDKVAKIVEQEMENAVKLQVPLVAEVATGKNWALAK